MIHAAIRHRPRVHTLAAALLVAAAVGFLVGPTRTSAAHAPDLSVRTESPCRWRPTRGELHATSKHSFEVRAIAAIRQRNAWAVGAQGRTGEGGFAAPFVEHWDGQAWSEATPPALTKRDRLDDLMVISARDIWAVGETWGGRPLAVRWNGRTWSRSSPAPVDAHYRYFNAVDGASTDDVWAVGHATPGPLIQHWDGSSWQVVPSPDLGLAPEQLASLTDVSALSTDDAWAVGRSSAIGSGSGNARCLRLET
jgi:hypothetical protein